MLIAGADPRLDAPLVNSRIRKAVRKGGATVFRIGKGLDPAYPLPLLGDALGLLANPPGQLTAPSAKAERPLLVIGSRNASAAVLKAAQVLGFVRDGWNGFKVLPVAASLGGAMTTGWAGEGPVSYTHLDVYKRQP